MKNTLGTLLQRGAAFQFSVCGFRRGPGRAWGGGGLRAVWLHSSVNKGASISLYSFAGTKYHDQWNSYLIKGTSQAPPAYVQCCSVACSAELICWTDKRSFNLRMACNVWPWLLKDLFLFFWQNKVLILNMELDLTWQIPEPAITAVVIIQNYLMCANEHAASQEFLHQCLFFWKLTLLLCSWVGWKGDVPLCWREQSSDGHNIVHANPLYLGFLPQN